MEIEKLESWYNKNRRELSFRLFKDPYRIWVSEIMLQQTQVDTVLPYYDRFLKVYPNVVELAQTSEETLHKMVEGLGYYRRFGNMLLAAREIVEKHGGKFPNTYDEIRALPGIGKYTAGAILSIAYNQPYSALDGNVIRVLSRYLGIQGDMRQEKNRKHLDTINQSLIEKAHPEIYTQAVMELGALVCKPTKPFCAECPLRETCFAFAHQAVEDYPEISKTKAKRILHFVTFILRKDGQLLLKKREENLLKGMYLYPQLEADHLEEALNAMERTGVRLSISRHRGIVKHVFSHQTWVMDVYEAEVLKGMPEGCILVSDQAFEKLPMAVAHKKIVM